MQSITTKYMMPTDTKGARILAKAEAGKLTVPWDHSIGVKENYEAAALALAAKMNWSYGAWHGGSAGDSGYVWVCVIGEGSSVVAIKGNL